MFNLVSLLVAAALVSHQCGFEANAQIESNNDLDNTLKPNVVATPKRRTIRPFVNISDAPPETAHLIPGTSLELTCVVIGHPAPLVEWLKNGESITDYDEANEIIPIHPSSLARLTAKIVISAASSGDVYTCVASSGLKQQMASTTVYTVEVEDESMYPLQALFRKPTKPTITEYYNDMFQDIGSSAVLVCRYHSNSPAQVYWTDSDGKPVYGDSKIQVLSSGDLLINNLRWDDMGNFSCTVKNMYGKDTVSTFVYPARKK